MTQTIPNSPEGSPVNGYRLNINFKIPEINLPQIGSQKKTLQL